MARIRILMSYLFSYYVHIMLDGHEGVIFKLQSFTSKKLRVVLMQYENKLQMIL